ncbi:MAG: hypothetical protein QOD86_524 [Miltoncostaeaceae bacterium]|jgi:hypothetical protein|nr:hypothetical protein [Miltoncostaeaceae bacterium]
MGTGRLVRRLAPLVAALAAGAVLAGCADEARIAEARAFRDAPLYWVGAEFAGLPIIGIGMSPNGGGVSYGTCDPPPGEKGCQPPLLIQTVRMCAPGFPVTPLTDRRPLRGVPAGMGGGGIVLLTRVVEVRVLALDPAVGRRAVAALRSTNPGGPDAVRGGEPFPAPPPGAERRTPCR